MLKDERTIFVASKQSDNSVVAIFDNQKALLDAIRTGKIKDGQHYISEELNVTFGDMVVEVLERQSSTEHEGFCGNLIELIQFHKDASGRIEHGESLERRLISTDESKIDDLLDALKEAADKWAAANGLESHIYGAECDEEPVSAFEALL